MWRSSQHAHVTRMLTISDHLATRRVLASCVLGVITPPESPAHQGKVDQGKRMVTAGEFSKMSRSPCWQLYVLICLKRFSTLESVLFSKDLFLCFPSQLGG